MEQKTRQLACTVIMLAVMSMSNCAAPTRFAVYCRQQGGDLKYGVNEPEAHCEFQDGSQCDSKAFQNGECSNQGASQSATTQQAAQSIGDGLPAPTTSQELLKNASLIFIGEVGPVIERRRFAGYGPTGELLDGAKSGNPEANVPYTDFVLKVERIIKDDGSVANGKPIILRMAGEATTETKRLTASSSYPFSYTGDRHLFLLGHEPDGIAYGLYYGTWSRLIIDDKSRLRVSDNSQQFLKLDGSSPITLETFIALVGK